MLYFFFFCRLNLMCRGVKREDKLKVKIIRGLNTDTDTFVTTLNTAELNTVIKKEKEIHLSVLVSCFLI